MIINSINAYSIRSRGMIYSSIDTITPKNVLKSNELKTNENISPKNRSNNFEAAAEYSNAVKSINNLQPVCKIPKTKSHSRVIDTADLTSKGNLNEHHQTKRHLLLPFNIKQNLESVYWLSPSESSAKRQCKNVQNCQDSYHFSPNFGFNGKSSHINNNSSSNNNTLYGNTHEHCNIALSGLNVRNCTFTQQKHQVNFCTQEQTVNYNNCDLCPNVVDSINGNDCTFLADTTSSAINTPRPNLRVASNQSNNTNNSNMQYRNYNLCQVTNTSNSFTNTLNCPTALVLNNSTSMRHSLSHDKYSVRAVNNSSHRQLDSNNICYENIEHNKQHWNDFIFEFDKSNLEKIANNYTNSTDWSNVLVTPRCHDASTSLSFHQMSVETTENTPVEYHKLCVDSTKKFEQPMAAYFKDSTPSTNIKYSACKTPRNYLSSARRFQRTHQATFSNAAMSSPTICDLGPRRRSINYELLGSYLLSSSPFIG